MNKKILLIITAVTLMITSGCSLVANLGTGVHPSGNVTSEDRSVSGFDSISLSGAGDMSIEQGDVEALTVEADDNLMQYITTRVRGNTLEIGLKDGVNILGLTKIVYRVKVKDLKSIEISGLGNVTMDGLKTDELKLSTSGSGQFNLKGIEANRITADSSGFGIVNLSGKAPQVKLSINGSGSFDGSDLEAQSVSIEISGAGSATVWAKEALDVQVSGGGLVRYYGNPKITEEFSGAGSINKAGDK